MDLQKNQSLSFDFTIEHLIDKLKKISNICLTSWRKLIISAFFGAILGSGLWYVFPGYKATTSIIISKTFDQTGWRIMQKQLPYFAKQILERHSYDDKYKDVLEKISHQIWWEKNTSPAYVLTRAEAKELSLPQTEGPLLAAISRIHLSAHGKSQQQSIENGEFIVSIIKKGGAYMQLLDIIDEQKRKYQIEDASLQVKLIKLRIDSDYIKSRIDELEKIDKRSYEKSGNLVYIPFDANDKYLPISLQISALKNELFINLESQSRINSQRKTDIFRKKWIQAAEDLMQGGSFDGIEISEKLIAFGDDAGNNLEPMELSGQLYFDEMRVFLAAIVQQYKFGISLSSPFNASQSALVKFMVFGSIGALFAMFIALIGSALCKFTLHGRAS